MSWTDERIELLKKLWADGLSASQIAGELGGVTRNGVIGKVHRLGLVGRKERGAAPKPARSRNTPFRKAAPNVIQPEQIPPPPLAPWSDKHKIHFMSFTHNHKKCSWPLWGDDTPAEDKFYCGAVTSDNRLCWFHCGIGYQAPAPRKGRPYWVNNGKAA